MKQVLSSVVVFSSVTSAVAQFIPGHVFVTEPASQGCSPYYGQYDRIWEINPRTGQVSLFAKLPIELCGSLTSVTFTPDGTRFRVSSFFQHAISEFDASGDFIIVLDSDDGVDRPGGFPGLAYDEDGSFYVANNKYAHWKILRFPVDGGDAEVVADLNDGIANPDAIAFAANGDLYFSGGGGPWGSVSVVLRFAATGERFIFEVSGFTGPIFTSLVGDRDGHMYVASDEGDILSYSSGDPTTRETLVADRFFGPYAITMSPDQTHLYVANLHTLYTVDVQTGDVQVIAELPFEAGGRASGIGVAPARVGDIDRTGQIDLGDVAVFQACFGGSGPTEFFDPCHGTDMDRDGTVSLLDFKLLQGALAGSWWQESR
jgi:DNA-binding beta-propeller fold protein YncE